MTDTSTKAPPVGRKFRKATHIKVTAYHMDTPVPDASGSPCHWSAVASSIIYDPNPVGAPDPDTAHIFAMVLQPLQVTEVGSTRDDSIMRAARSLLIKLGLTIEPGDR
jgi:hypothetical protein